MANYFFKVIKTISQQNPQTRITHTDPNDPLPTPQLTNDNSLTGLQERQRAPLKHSHRCLENHTRTEIQLRVRHRMRKLTTGLLTSTQIHIPIRIMHEVNMRVIVKTK